MTLDTRIYLTGDVDPHELHSFINEVLLKAPHAKFTDEAKEDWVTKEPTGTWGLENKPGQGLDAWMMMSYRPGGELATEDVWVTEDDGERWLDQKKCTVEVSFDTAYGGRSQDGLSCTTLHMGYIVALYYWAADRGASIVWRNEYSGEYFDGLDGLEEFGGHGDQAMNWFNTSVLPAIAAGLLAEEGE